MTLREVHGPLRRARRSRCPILGVFQYLICFNVKKRRTPSFATTRIVRWISRGRVVRFRVRTTNPRVPVESGRRAASRKRASGEARIWGYLSAKESKRLAKEAGFRRKKAQRRS